MSDGLKLRIAENTEKIAHSLNQPIYSDLDSEYIKRIFGSETFDILEALAEKNNIFAYNEYCKFIYRHIAIKKEGCFRGMKLPKRYHYVSHTFDIEIHKDLGITAEKDVKIPYLRFETQEVNLYYRIDIDSLPIKTDGDNISVAKLQHLITTGEIELPKAILDSIQEKMKREYRPTREQLMQACTPTEKDKVEAGRYYIEDAKVYPSVREEILSKFMKAQPYEFQGFMMSCINLNLHELLNKGVKGQFGSDVQVTCQNIFDTLVSKRCASNIQKLFNRHPDLKKLASTYGDYIIEVKRKYAMPTMPDELTALYQ